MKDVSSTTFLEIMCELFNSASLKLDSTEPIVICGLSELHFDFVFIHYLYLFNT